MSTCPSRSRGCLALPLRRSPLTPAASLRWHFAAPCVVLRGLPSLIRPLTVFALPSRPEGKHALRPVLPTEGYDVARGVGGHGVVGVLVNGSGRRVMFRVELDALPVEEQTGLP